MEIKYVDHLGDDLTVVNAARVSFSKFSEEFSDKDKGLVNYLAKHGHWTPFAHPQITLHTKLPMFVQRQFDKHQVGFVVNEVSRRYVDDTPEFYRPSVWRGRPDGSIKQGSSSAEYRDRLDIGGRSGTVSEMVDDVLDDVRQLYEQMIAGGCAPEMARMVLPMSMYTETWKTGSLMGWANCYKLRSDSHAQLEIQEVARQIDEVIRPLYPVAWGALVDEHD